MHNEHNLIIKQHLGDYISRVEKMIFSTEQGLMYALNVYPGMY
jgi:hypothetical protein